MKLFKLTTLLIGPLLFGCNQADDKTNSAPTLTQDENANKKSQLQVSSGDNISYEGKELTFIQDILDTSNATRGKVYVELIAGDSIFKRLYIFDGTALKYFAGDGLLTNLSDTTKAVDNYFGIKFIARDKYFIDIEIADKAGHGASDTWRIEYIIAKKRFDNPYFNVSRQ